MCMRRGITTIGIVSGVVFIAVISAIFVFSGSENNKESNSVAGELYEVVTGSFSITVPTSGELSAKEQVTIHNKLESGAVIIELVDEGSQVAEGDVLLRLNDEAIKNKIQEAELSVTSAKNNLDTSKSSLVIAGKKRDSELAAKQLAIDLAGLALKAWKEGDVVARRQQLSLAVQTAEKDYQRLFKKHESSVKLYEKKFLSKDELDRDEISLLNAEATYKKAKLDVEVYENYTYKQEEQQKNSSLQQAIDELDRAEERLASELNNLQATVDARTNQLGSQIEKLEKRKSQLKMCVVTSPASGMVVYATSVGDRRDEGEPMKVGKGLYRNELVMMIPDITNMIARVKVNEALSGLVKKGQTATITCDAYPDDVFDGEVLSVGVLAEGGGWRDPNRRDYTVEIKIVSAGNVELKPSMRCSADIFVEDVTDVLYVPIHAIHRTGKVVWVWMNRGNGYGQHPVSLGRFSDSYAEIIDGVTVGDLVLLREPSPGQVVDRLATGE